MIHTSSWGWCEICWRAPGMSVVQISCLFRCANRSGGQKSDSEGVIQSNALAAQRRGTESDVRRPHGGCSLLAWLWNHVLVHHFHKIVVYCEFNCLQPIALLTSRCLWNTGKGYWVIAYWILIVHRVWLWEYLKIWIWCRERFCDLSSSDPARWWTGLQKYFFNIGVIQALETNYQFSSEGPLPQRFSTERIRTHSINRHYETWRWC